MRVTDVQGSQDRHNVRGSGDAAQPGAAGHRLRAVRASLDAPGTVPLPRRTAGHLDAPRNARARADHRHQVDGRRVQAGHETPR